MIGYSDRTLLVGMTQSGKSELANWFFAQRKVRRVLVDSKREYSIAGVPVHVLRARDDAAARSEVDAIDWTDGIVHVRHSWLGDPGSREQLTALFERVSSLREPVVTTLHEAYAVCSKAWQPPGLREEAVSGAGRGHGLDVCTQRPVNIAKELLTEVTHLFLFPPLDEEDLKESRRGLPFLTAARAQELAADVPQYGYIWADRRTRRVDVGDPLPDYLRAATDRLVRRVG